MDDEAGWRAASGISGAFFSASYLEAICEVLRSREIKMRNVSSIHLINKRRTPCSPEMSYQRNAHQRIMPAGERYCIKRRSSSAELRRMKSARQAVLNF